MTIGRGDRRRIDGKKGAVVASIKLAIRPESLKDTGPLWILAVRNSTCLFPQTYSIGALAMPIYEHKCQECNRTIEILQGIFDSPAEKCKECGGKLKKLISRSSFILLGDGWFATSSKKEDKDK